MDLGGRLRREPAVESNAWSSCREQLLIECSHCGEAVKVIACIEDPAVIDRSVCAGLRYDGCGGRR
jgi:hypothetical protein